MIILNWPFNPRICMKKKKIDYIIVSEDVLQNSIRARHNPFGYICISDHKGGCVNIPMGERLGTQPVDSTSSPHRRLQVDKPQMISNYIQLLTKIYISHNVLQKSKAMEKNMTKNRKRRRGIDWRKNSENWIKRDSCI